MFETVEDRVTTEFCELRGIHPTLEDALAFDLEAEGWEKLDFGKDYPLHPHENVLAIHYGEEIYRSGDRWMCVSDLDRRNRLYVILEAPDQDNKDPWSDPNAYYFKIEKCVVVDRHGNYWNAIDEMDPGSNAYLRLYPSKIMSSGGGFSPVFKDLYVRSMRTWPDIEILLHEVGHQRMSKVYSTEENDIYVRAISLYRRSILDLDSEKRLNFAEVISRLEEEYKLTLLDAMRIINVNERGASRFGLLHIRNLAEIYKINKNDYLEILDRNSRGLLYYDVIPIPFSSASYEFRSLPLELQQTYLRYYDLLRSVYVELTRISESNYEDDYEGVYEFIIDGKMIAVYKEGSIFIDIKDRRFGSFEEKRIEFSLEGFSVYRIGQRPPTGIKHRDPRVESFDFIDFRYPALLREAYKDHRFALLLESLDLLDAILPNLQLIGKQTDPQIEQDTSEA